MLSKRSLNHLQSSQKLRNFPKMFPENVKGEVNDMEMNEVADLVATEPDTAVIGESEWKDTDAIRYLQLYFWLCSKHHDFLDE